MEKPLHILMVEDVQADAELAARELKRAGMQFDIRRVENKPDFLAALDEFAPDIIISDYKMPSFDGLTALKLARENRPQTPFIFLSGTLGEDRAVESLKQGASDYVVKGHLQRLAPAITRALQEARLRLEHQRTQDALRESEVRFRLLAEQAPVGIYLVTPDGHATYVNQYWRDITGITAENIYGEVWTATTHPDDRDWVEKKAREGTPVGAPFNAEYRYVRPSGQVIWAIARAKAQLDTDGNITGFVGVLHDITERKQAEDKISRLSRIHEVLSGINAAIVRNHDRQTLFNEVCRLAVEKGRFQIATIMFDETGSGKLTIVARAGTQRPIPEGTHAYVDPGLAEGRGTVGEAMRTLKPSVSNDAPNDPRLAPWKEILANRSIRSVASLPLSVNGKAVGVLMLLSSEENFFTSQELDLLKQFTADVSFALDRINADERLDYLAYYDVLTGLPNRALFHDRLSQQISEAERSNSQLAVVAMDLERFRHINESFGRETGDSLLQEVAQRMRLYVSDPGHIARISGDEFAAFVPGVRDATAIAHLIEHRFSRGLTTPIVINGYSLTMSAKAGVALYPGDGSDAETLFRNAEAALKESKTSGEKVVFYAKEINAHVERLLSLENGLRRAIEQHEFVLHYQPKLDLQHRHVTSLEALIRWNKPGAGLVPPGEFIPILEETGMIYDVGHWALAQALADFALMSRTIPHPPRIAVNVSALQLRKTTFVEDMRSLLQTAQSDDHGLDIEITESLVMRNVEENIGKLSAIRDMNIRIAVDDFGTGYSSLSYIAKLPIDVLKIDRSFIMRMDNSADDLAIVSSVISLAHALKIKVVAEGVETEEQAKMLHLLSCDEVQGYLFCKPLPLADLLARLDNGNGNTLRAAP